jgi:hypothetical protein
MKTEFIKYMKWAGRWSNQKTSPDTHKDRIGWRKQSLGYLLHWSWFDDSQRVKVNLQKDLCSNQLIKQEINAGQWILVLHDYCVEWSIIDAQPLGLVLLQHKDSRATPWRTAGSDIPLIEQFLQLGL